MLNVKNVFRTAGIMILATLLAKVMGMCREVLVASLYGVGDVAQAFTAATQIPLLFFDICLGAAISSSFIPVFNEYMEKGEREEAFRYSNIFINVIFLITLVVCTVGMVFSRQIVGIIGNGLEGATKDLAARLVIILFPTMVFTALAYAMSGLLQSLGEFNVPAAISLVSNGFMVVYLLVVRDKLGIEGVAAAMLIGWSLQVLVQVPSLVKRKYRYRPVVNLRHPGIVKSARLALPILISSWVQPINTSINLYLASSLNGGQAMPALNYANKLYIILVGVLTYAVSNLIFPSISRLAAGDDKDEFRHIITRALSAVVAIIVPVMVLFVLLRVPIIQFVYERGEFGPEATALTAKALLYYSLGMAGFAATEILNKAFYSLHDGKTPMYIAMGGIAVNVALSFLFVRGLGMELEGLALAASIAAWLIALALVVAAHRRMRLVTGQLLLNFVKIACCAVVMGIGVWFVAQFFPAGASLWSKLVALCVPSAAGVVLYMAAAWLVRCEESKIVIDGIKKRFSGRRA